MATANIKQEQRETQLDACLKMLHVFSALEIVSSELAKEAKKLPDTPKLVQRGINVLQDNIEVIAERSRAISLLPRDPIVNEEYGDWSNRAAQLLAQLQSLVEKVGLNLKTERQTNIHAIKDRKSQSVLNGFLFPLEVFFKPGEHPPFNQNLT